MQCAAAFTATYSCLLFTYSAAMSQAEVTPVVATDTKPGAPEGDPLTKITPAQLQMIGETWGIVSKDLQGAGLIMFKK